MNITRYEPWNVLSQFQRDLDRVFRNVDSAEDNDSTIATSTWMPSVDIKEDADAFTIEADIPGVDPKDIEVSMENAVLTIKGERNLEKREEDKAYKRVERLHGSFYRRFSLPETADPDKISASGKNGVLQVRIPKREIAQPRKITVKS